VITWDSPAGPVLAPDGSQPLDTIDFVVVDVETTGWTPGKAQITEIGAVRISGGKLKAQFTSLINPGGPIPDRVTDLTGITDAMVVAAPPLDRVLPAFLAFASGGVLTAHNAPFDIGFLIAACRACGLPWPRLPVVDTVELARRVLGEDEVPNRKLATLAEYFGARTMPSHRALADALATADVLTALLPRLAAAGISTLDEIRLRGVPGIWPRWQALAGHWFRRRPGQARRGWFQRRPGQSRGGRRAVRYRPWLGTGTRGGRRGHRDRPGESGRGAHPGNGGGDRADPPGQ
jgi:DNA polymerase III epsilon subunit family exonuclease